MEEKKEVQRTIVQSPTTGKVSEEEFFSVLKMVAPGTNLRTALDGTLKAGKGALIVLENENVLPVIDGGFRVNCKFTPQKLMELTKREELASLLKNVQEIIPLRALPDETYLDEIESVIRGVLPKEALVRSGVVEKLRQIQGDQSVMLAADWITLTEEEAKMLDMVPERFRVSVSLQGALSNYLTLAGNTLKAVLTAA